MMNKPTNAAPAAPPRTVNPTVKSLALACIERCENFGLKRGRKRDEIVVEFFTGACAALTTINHPHANVVMLTTQMMICVLGFDALTRIVDMPTSDPRPDRLPKGSDSVGPSVLPGSWVEE